MSEARSTGATAADALRSFREAITAWVFEQQLRGETIQLPAPSELFVRIKEETNACDPEGLIRRGAPDDEYEPEVQELVARIREVDRDASDARLARDVFERWFGPKTYRDGRFDAFGVRLYGLRRWMLDEAAPTIDR